MVRTKETTDCVQPVSDCVQPVSDCVQPAFLTFDFLKDNLCSPVDVYAEPKWSCNDSVNVSNPSRDQVKVSTEFKMRARTAAS